MHNKRSHVACLECWDGSTGEHRFVITNKNLIQTFTSDPSWLLFTAGTSLETTLFSFRAGCLILVWTTVFTERLRLWNGGTAGGSITGQMKGPIAWEQTGNLPKLTSSVCSWLVRSYRTSVHQSRPGEQLWLGLGPPAGNQKPQVIPKGQSWLLWSVFFCRLLPSNCTVHLESSGAGLQTQETFSKNLFLCISLRGQVQRSSWDNKELYNKYIIMGLTTLIKRGNTVKGGVTATNHPRTFP